MTLEALDGEVDGRIATLTATAVAGAEFIHEWQISRLTRDVDEALAKLTPADLPGARDSGSELADQTEAVLSAYCELNARYGGDG